MPNHPRHQQSGNAHVKHVSLARHNVNVISPLLRHESPSLVHSPSSFASSKYPNASSFRAKRGICRPHCRSQQQQIPPGQERPFGMTKFYGFRRRTAASTPHIPRQNTCAPQSLSFRRLSGAKKEESAAMPPTLPPNKTISQLTAIDRPGICREEPSHLFPQPSTAIIPIPCDAQPLPRKLK
jgi:hypothetical protein